MGGQGNSSDIPDSIMLLVVLSFIASTVLTVTAVLPLALPPTVDQHIDRRPSRLLNVTIIQQPLRPACYYFPAV